ncbi:BrnT family toxin [Novosphingobium sp. B 225]|uniref:BrnT family toxin n=1 Tax=Novosphingobium sp. B 225 TaxID=1961849 RepID=UPI000B4B1B64
MKACRTTLSSCRRTLADFSGFDEDPVVFEDIRKDYGEQRFIAVGRIARLPHLIVYVRRDDKIRLIGFRRAHEKELRRYEQNAASR